MVRHVSNIPRLLCVALLIGAMSDSGVAQERIGRVFSFGVFGDLAYRPMDEKKLSAVLTEINRESLAFVVHVGDLGSPKYGSCTDQLLNRRVAQFKASTHPLIYTPGDNEWTDCPDVQNLPGNGPLGRLKKIRDLFFAGNQSLGQRSLTVVRQSDDRKFQKFRENVRFDLGGVTFLTLHVVGSNNNLGHSQARDEEFAERNQANLSWVRTAFMHAKANKSRALVLMQQGNMFPALSPFPGNRWARPNGYIELRRAVARESKTFGKPVAIIHGDSHYFRVDKPFMLPPRLRRRTGEPHVANVTRVETFGHPHHHWVQVTVDLDNPNIFSVRPRMVPANVAK